MINAQRFSYPTIKVKHEGFISPDVFPEFRIIRLKWASILGRDNKELTTISLANSPKFRIFVKGTREDFKSNSTNLRRFPKMNASDWE